MRLASVLHVCKTDAVPPTSGPRVLTLSGKELVVLQLLLREKRLFGLQLVAASKGRLKRGTVYVTLGRMEEKGYITSTLEDPPPGAGGLPRRLYEPTALGRRMVRTWTSGGHPRDPGVRAMSGTDWLRARAARWCSPRTMERVIEPALADVQTEYEAAARDGRIWRSRWIRIAGHAAFLKVLAWVIAERALDALRGATASDRHALGRTFAVFAAVTALGTGLLTLPPLLAEWSRCDLRALSGLESC